MFFQETTPDTSGYMIAGYAVAFIVMALYIASIYLRARNLHQDMTMLAEMEKPAEKPVPPIQSSSAPRPKKTPAKSAGKKPVKAAGKKTRKKY